MAVHQDDPYLEKYGYLLNRAWVHADLPAPTNAQIEALSYLIVALTDGDQNREASSVTYEFSSGRLTEFTIRDRDGCLIGGKAFRPDGSEIPLLDLDDKD